jgi:hypothetical protein
LPGGADLAPGSLERIGGKVTVSDKDREEHDLRKKAIFDGMGKRGRERILRIGYENWDPFMEPKDPRERIFSDVSRRAAAIVQEFYRSRPDKQEESVALNKDLFDLCRGLLQGDQRARTIFEFCNWFGKNSG